MQIKNIYNLLFILIPSALFAMHKEKEKILLAGPVNIILQYVHNKSDIAFGIELVDSQRNKKAFVVNPTATYAVNQTYANLDIYTQKKNASPSFILYKRIPVYCIPLTHDAGFYYTRIALFYGIQITRALIDSYYQPVIVVKELKTTPSKRTYAHPEFYNLPKKGGTLSLNLEIESANSIKYAINSFDKNKLKHQKIVDQIYACKNGSSYIHALPVEIKGELKKYLVTRYFFKKVAHHTHKLISSENKQCSIS